MVAWLSFAFPLLIFILGPVFNYIIVLLKSCDAAYKKGTVKEIRVWKNVACSRRSDSVERRAFFTSHRSPLSERLEQARKNGDAQWKFY